MDEFEIIRRFFTPEQTSESVIIGVGDDGAVLRPDPDRDLVAVVDTLVEGVHFPPGMRAGDIGWRAIAANLSDIAAMGGRPRWMTMGLTLQESEPGWLGEFAAGIAQIAAAFDVELVGGDITHGRELVLSIQVIGDVGRGSALTRHGAKPGDSIYVSGTPGDAAAGLSLMQRNTAGEAAGDGTVYLVGRFCRPSPRVALGQAIAGAASAAIDVSDGLYADLGKLLAASGVAGTLRIEDVPLSDALRAAVRIEDARQSALCGGEDFELCFTSAQDLGDSSVIAGVRVTRIGAIHKGSGLACTLLDAAYDYRDSGYRHFR